MIRFATALSAARAPMAAFAAMGLCWGSFAADLPDIQVMLGVTEARLGVLLFLTPVAAVCAMLAAPLLARWGGAHALTWSSLFMALAFFLPGQANGQVFAVAAFPLAMIACGLGTGLTDVLMNARVAAIEARTGGSLMNLAHAVYSFGFAAGAVGVGMLRAMGMAPGQVLAVTALVSAGVALLSYEAEGRIDGLDRPRGKGAARLGWVPVLGGAIVFIAFLTENASENWAAFYIERTLGGSPSHGAMGPAVLALTMGVARLFGQGFAARIAPARLLMAGAVVAASGLIVAATASGPGMAYAGFVVAGIGGSVISPTAFSMVGALSRPQARARAIARATLVGYLGYFVGPPAFGFLAGGVGLRITFGVAALLLASILVLAPIMGRRAGH